jgi:hypothetical protein
MTIANPVTWSNLCTEFSLNPTTAVFPASFYGKGGAPASGTLGFQDFVGRSAGAVSYTPNPGTYSFTDNGAIGGGTGASASITRTGGSAVWTYTISGTNAGLVNASISSGGSAANVTFSLSSNHISSANRSAQVVLSQAGNTWTLNLFASGDGGGP